MTRVFLADDHPLMLAGIASLLANSHLQVVGQASDGATALQEIITARPDIALMDVSMPGLSGIEVLRSLRDIGSETRVVLLTAQIDDEDLLEAMRLDVEGIVLKDGGDRQLIDCLDRVAAGSHWIPREIINRATRLAREREQDPLKQLSERERSVAALVAQGMRNRSIAQELGLTEGTVKVYLNRIYEKLSISNRTELAVAISGARPLGG